MDLGSVTRPARRALGAALALLVPAALAVVGAAPAGAASFQNSAPITIPAGAPGTTFGPASPYPSAISVTGLSGQIVDVNATLTNLSHTFPPDIDVLLVGPSGQTVVLMADTGGAPASPVTLAFDDAAAGGIGFTPLTSGTYRPTNAGAFSGGAPAPPGPYGSTLSVFNGTAANGTWNLFVYDDAGGDVGSIAGGWSLTISTNAPTITSFNPTSGTPGTSVTITGTNLGGFTSVTFGGALAGVTSSSATQIVATVPNNAVTGPIAVTTPNGTATSATSFTVVSLDHPRDVTLSVGRKAKGRVSVTDGFSACASGVPVKVQRREAGHWELVGTDQTASDGKYVVLGTSDPGRYRALAKRVTLASGDVCLKAVSPAVTH